MVKFFSLRVATGLLFITFLVSTVLSSPTSLALPLAAPPPKSLLAPMLQAIKPVANTHTAPVTTTVSIVYNENINPATVSPQTFAVHARQTGQLAQTFQVNGGNITLIPPQPFKPGELVQVTATTGALNFSGAGSVSATVWEFRTAVKAGSGAFVSGSWVGSSNGREVALGDLDGDGDLDAFFARDPHSNQVWLNNGDSTFTHTNQSLGNSQSRSVALGDLDGDGDLDAFVGNYCENDKVYLNDGAGSFSLGQSINSLSLCTKTVALGDVDGDGDLDALVGVDGGEIWLNNGQGTFSDSGQSLGASSIWAATLADLDEDGDLDALTSSGTSSIWVNDGLGHFTNSGQSAGSGTDVALGDIDGDGDLDLLTGGGSYEPNEIWVNNGGLQGGLLGTFSYDNQFLGVTASDTPVTLGDVNGDGHLDALIGFWGGVGDKIWLNDGTGTFIDSNQSLGSSWAWDVSLDDLDQDGDLDAFILDTSGARIWLNTGQNQALAGLTAVNNSPTTLGQATTLTTNISAGSGPITFFWSLGDGETAAGQMVRHTYKAPGNYTAIVTASNSINSLSEATAVTIVPPVTYLPLVLKLELTNLYVFNDNTGGDLTFTVVGTGVSCIVPNKTTQFCGSFLPGAYTVQVTTICGFSSEIKTYDPGRQIQRITCSVYSEFN